MRPSEVLDAQGDLLLRAQGIDYRSLLVSIVGEAGSREDREATGYEMADKLVSTLKVAYAYSVSPDMCRLIQFAATQLDESDLFDRDLAPTQAGIVCFQEPIPMVNHRGRTTLMHWLVWGPGVIISLTPEGQGERAGSTILYTFNDVWRRPDESYAATQNQLSDHNREFLEHAMGRWSMNACEIAASGGIGPPDVDPDDVAVAWLTEFGLQEVGIVPRTNPIRYLHALWLMLDQTIAHVDQEPLERSSRRRAKRMQIPAEVTVVKLRREDISDRPPGESEVEWQHRWIVRGHWRWQAYGPGRAERKRIWINPFVKGPEGAPLKQSEKVYSLER